MTDFEKKNNATNDCDRKEDLVAYLYDEASAPERASFARHLKDCVSCRSELMAFGRVRDDLSAWQVGFSPRAEIALPKRKLDILREFITLFPVWARGAALAAASAALLLGALSFAGTRVNLRGIPGAGQLQASASSDEIETLIKKAVAEEREKIRDEYRSEMASLKEQLKVEHEAQLQAINATNQAKLAAVKAGLTAEIKRSNRQNSSIRSFFALEDFQDPVGDGR
jgi:anti-sigma factor RsiW